MRNVENKKIIICRCRCRQQNIVATYVDTLQKSYGQRCPHCGTVVSNLYSNRCNF